MIECCSACNKYMKLEKADYSDKGCKHSDYDGFACLAFADEGIIVHMVGVNPDKGMCELHSDREPSAQPKRGKWIGADYDWDIGIYACDQCGRFAMMKSGYCPNCGADMRGKEDE